MKLFSQQITAETRLKKDLYSIFRYFIVNSNTRITISSSSSSIRMKYNFKKFKFLVTKRDINMQMQPVVIIQQCYVTNVSYSCTLTLRFALFDAFLPPSLSLSFSLLAFCM